MKISEVFIIVIPAGNSGLFMLLFPKMLPFLQDVKATRAASTMRVNFPAVNDCDM
jgi:hypothetical protein